ncbi:MAG: hypothetical protein V1865_01990 [bacterium]
MTLRSYLVLMILATFVCFFSFTISVMMIDPNTTNWVGFSLFYLSLFFSLMGFMSILGFLLRFVFLRKELESHLVIISFRQAFLVSFLVVAVLFLLSINLFSWLNLLLLIIVFSALEFFLLSYETNTANIQNIEE